MQTVYLLIRPKNQFPFFLLLHEQKTTEMRMTPKRVKLICTTFPQHLPFGVKMEIEKRNGMDI